MRTHVRQTALPAALVAALWTAPALSQHDHGASSAHGDHAHETVAKARTFGEASRRIADAVHAIRTALDGGSLAGVSDSANAVVVLGKQLGALALAPDSGIARDRVKEANLAGKDLAEAAEVLHDASDGGDLSLSKTHLAMLLSAASRVEALAPAAYFCPMHCEGDKTYDKPGECPVCRMHLVRQTSERFTVDLTRGDGNVEAGKPVTLGFTLKDPRGMQVKALEIVHERPLHLLMVSRDLSWFAHEHPARRQDGTFELPWTFPAGGEYTLFLDFTPQGVGMQVVPVTLKVDGATPPPAALTPDIDASKTIDGYTVTLDTDGPVMTGKDTHLSFSIMKDGTPVTTLAPYLGALGHLVILSGDLKTFVHAHPHEGAEHDTGSAHGAAAMSPNVDFGARFASPGVYRAWAQFNVGTAERERVLTVPFTFSVSAGAGGSHGGGGHGATGHPTNAAVNSVCPMTGERASERHTRTFNGQLVAFCAGECARQWDGMTNEDRMARLVTALTAGAASHADGAHDDEMPEGVSLADARALYLTAGGKYTEADIKANGATTAYEKYKGQMAKHDTKPKSGDALCPITMTKANPRFTWVIGGQTYQFCCPPCIDEFVLLAKQHPEELKAPSEYVKK